MFKVSSPTRLVVTLVAAAAFSVLLDTLCGITRWPVYVLSSFVSVGLLLITLQVLTLLDDRLAKRVIATDGGEWIVRINGVTVGSISEQLRATIQREALHDPALAVAQLLNLLKFPLRVANTILTAIPAFCFWVVVGALAFYPEDVRAFLANTPDAAALSQAIRTAAPHIAMIFITTSGAMVVMGYRFGLRNVYGEFVASTIRRLCDTPAQGEITLWRQAHFDGLRVQAQSEIASAAQRAD